MAAEKNSDNIIDIMETKTERTVKENRVTFGARIHNARIARGLSQPRLAEALGVTRTFVSNWETGRARPDMKLIPQLCDILEISIGEFFGFPNDLHSLDRQTRELVDAFKALDARDRQAVKIMVESLRDTRHSDKVAYCRKFFRSIPVSDLAASAGTGDFLDDARATERLRLRSDGIAGRANVIIPVNGDSMEPTFNDHDLLLVEYTEELQEGEIGIIIIDGEGFVKEYHHNGVYSHNYQKYKFRRFMPGDDIRCVGRVLGKVDDSMYPTSEEQSILSELAAEAGKH